MTRSKKKEVGIVFPYNWAKFSPSFYNLLNLISENHQINLITFDQDLGFLKNNINLKLVKVKFKNNFIYTFIEKIFNKINFQFSFKDFIFIHKVKIFSKQKFDILLFFDPISFYAVKKYSSIKIFYSLELVYGDRYFSYLKKNQNLIDIVITQSKERYDFFFLKSKIPYKIVHNSPYYIKKPNISLDQRNNFVFFGSFINQFGSNHLINYFQNVNEYLFISNINKSKNINLKNIILEKNYIFEKDITDYLSKFKIGFSFFDLDQIEDSMKFNFETGPSGKIYNYFLACTPLICNNIKAFKMIEDFNCGILVNDFDPSTINNAINKILNNYTFYQKGCVEASKYYDYRKCSRILYKIF